MSEAFLLRHWNIHDAPARKLEHHLEEYNRFHSRIQAQKGIHDNHNSYNIETRNRIIIPDPRENEWWDSYELLCNYQKKYGHCYVPAPSSTNTDSSDDYPTLYKWTSAQRRYYQKKLSQPTNETRLQEFWNSTKYQALLDIDFVWNISEFHWENQYQQLQQFYHDHGHCNVDSSSSLSIWMKTQRNLNRQKKLDPERVAKLIALKFDWNPTTWKTRLLNGDDQWKLRLEELKQYKTEYGDYYVPQHYKGTHGNSTLGHWVDSQRQIYRQLQIQKEKAKNDSSIAISPLLQTRIVKLNAIGFQWSAKHKKHSPRDRLWYERLDDLMEYKKQHGNCLVPLRYRPNPKLGRWVCTQRQQYRLKKTQEEEGGVEEGEMKSMMNEERQKILDNVGFVWTVRQRRPKRTTTKNKIIVVQEANVTPATNNEE